MSSIQPLSHSSSSSKPVAQKEDTAQQPKESLFAAADQEGFLQEDAVQTSSLFQLPANLPLKKTTYGKPSSDLPTKQLDAFLDKINQAPQCKHSFLLLDVITDIQAQWSCKTLTKEQLTGFTTRLQLLKIEGIETQEACAQFIQLLFHFAQHRHSFRRLGSPSTKLTTSIKRILEKIGFRREPHRFRILTGRLDLDGGPTHDYTGFFKQNWLPHGFGVANFENRMRYAGQWQNGLRSGFGVLTWPSGAHYEGLWSRDKRCGVGTYTWPSGSRYEGLWNNNKEHGFGVHAWPDGCRFEGRWYEGKKQFGTLTKADGLRIEGNWKTGWREENNIHGYGTITPADGFRREVIWKDGNILNYPSPDIFAWRSTSPYSKRSFERWQRICERERLACLNAYKEFKVQQKAHYTPTIDATTPLCQDTRNIVLGYLVGMSPFENPIEAQG